MPAVPTGSLSLPLPAMIRRRNDRVTAFVVKHTTGLGPFYPPAALYPCNRTRKPINPLHPILGQANSTLGLSRFTRFIEGSHLLANTRLSRPKPPWCWQQPPILTDPTDPFREGYFVPLAPHGSVTRAAFNGRLQGRETLVPLAPHGDGTMSSRRFPRRTPSS